MGSLAKVGFMMIALFLMFLFFNNMPNFLVEYSNFIVLAFIVFLGGLAFSIITNRS